MSAHATLTCDVSDDKYIATLWITSFQEVYSRQKNDGLLKYVKDQCSNDDNYIINVSKVTEAIQKLKCHKSCGPDGILAEALKHGGQMLAVHLTMLFNMFSCHCHLSKDLIQTTIVLF
jgi:hypothetical protein